MKKLYFLFLLLTPFFVNAQDVVYNFNTDGDTEGWQSSGTNLTVASNVMNVTLTDAVGSGFQLIRTTDGLNLPETNYLTLRIVVENNALAVDGTTPWTSYQIINYDSNSTNVGDAVKVDFTIADASGFQTIDIDIPSNPDNSGTIDRLGIRFKAAKNTLDASSNLNFDSVTIISSAPVTSTFSGFVQDPNFDDVSGLLPNWAPSSGDATVAASSTSNSGAQAAKVDIVNTLSGNVILWNDYTLTFDAPTTTAASGDNVVITWDMRSSSTTLEVSPRFKMGKTAGGNDLYTMAKKKVAAADTYESFSITKPLNSSVEYDDIYTLGFTVTSANAGDNVYIDNVTTTVTINGSTLGIDDVDFKDDTSISLYPNPVQNILRVKASGSINKIEIYNILGQNVLSVENSNAINVQHLNKGAYISKIFQDNDVVSTKRFFKD